MMTWSNNLFYVVFLGQILLISYYFPRKLLERMQYVLETYPPTAYPKLYPQPIEHYKIGHWVYKMVNRVILGLGFVILFSVMFLIDHSTFADDGYISEIFPAIYGLIQFLPGIALEFSEFNHLKQMRLANASTIRKAELRRRSVVDFVSPALLVIAFGLYVGSIVFDLYVHNFDVSWGHDTVQRGITITVTNLLLAGVGAWTLYGRNKDPHQTAEDRVRKIAPNLRALLYVSMAMSVYFMFVAADDLYDLGFLEAVLMSIYFQVIVFVSLGHVLRSINFEDINFDVYKNDVAMT